VEQVSFQTPFEVAGRQTVQVVISRDGVASTPTSVAVFELQPAVYTSGGVEAIAVHDADYTLVTAARPLVRGEYALVYATGLGAVTNRPASGAASPLSPLATTLVNTHVTLAGLPCEVPYAALVPTLAGVYQVDFRVPANAPSGLQDLVLTAGLATAPPVKVLVQ
jgi:uncharacterized protein (TIGR03437 family)